MADKEIQEVRQIRHAISAAHGHDLKRLFEHYRELEEQERQTGQHRFEDVTRADQTGRTSPGDPTWSEDRV